jgi:NAD(P)-dependent dehydrogenase (short-subunit alcohol dehydrogenase family)
VGGGRAFDLNIHSPACLYATFAPADETDREAVRRVVAEVQATTGRSVEVAFGDQGYTGVETYTTALQQGIQLEVVKLPDAKRGFVLLPRPLGRGAVFCLGSTFLALGTRLRTPARNAQGLTFSRFRLSHAQECLGPARSGSGLVVHNTL